MRIVINLYIKITPQFVKYAGRWYGSIVFVAHRSSGGH